ncbi:MAG: protein kinase [Alphaproteobacteria bacterium]
MVSNAPNASISEIRRLLRGGDLTASENRLGKALTIPADKIAAQIESAYLELLRDHPPQDIIQKIDVRLADGEIAPPLRARCLFIKGIASNRLGHVLQAINAFVEANRLYSSEGAHWAELAEVADALGTVYVWRGRLNDAARSFLNALAWWTRADDASGPLNTLANVGRMHLEAGRFEEAVAFFRTAADASKGALGLREKARLQINMAQALFELGEIGQALEYAQSGLELARNTGVSRLEWLARVEIARCLGEEGQEDNAARALEELEALTATDSASYERVSLVFLRAGFLARQKPEEAVPLIERVLQRFVEDDLAAPEVQARLMLGECFRRLGESRRSEKCFLIAATRARGRGLQRYVERAQQELLQVGEDRTTGADTFEAPDAGSDDEPPYIIRERLGGGGFGSVYRAYDPDRGREVALKVLKLGREYDSGRRRDLLATVRAELAALSRVRHPGIVRVLGAGEAPNGDIFVLEELIDGGSLRPAMQTIHDTAQICRVLARIASALQAVHSAGIVHRDIKPENILMRNGVSPVLIDFGIAWTQAVRADPFRATGTHGYISPEQQAGGAADARVDLYALGMIAHEWFTGERPAPAVAGGPFQGLKEIFGAGGTRGRGAGERKLHPSVSSLVISLIAKDPDSRPASAEDVARSFLLAASQI